MADEKQEEKKECCSKGSCCCKGVFFFIILLLIAGGVWWYFGCPCCPFCKTGDNNISPDTPAVTPPPTTPDTPPFTTPPVTPPPSTPPVTPPPSTPIVPPPLTPEQAQQRFDKVNECLTLLREVFPNGTSNLASLNTPPYIEVKNFLEAIYIPVDDYINAKGVAQDESWAKLLPAFANKKVDEAALTKLLTGAGIKLETTSDADLVQSYQAKKITQSQYVCAAYFKIVQKLSPLMK